MSCYHTGSIESFLLRMFCRRQFHSKSLINQESPALSQFQSSYKARVWPALHSQATTKTCTIRTILLPLLSPVPTATRTMTTTTTTNVPMATGTSAVPTTDLDSIGCWGLPPAVSTTTTGATQQQPAVPRPKSKKYPSRRQQLVLMLTQVTRRKPRRDWLGRGDCCGRACCRLCNKEEA